MSEILIFLWGMFQTPLEGCTLHAGYIHALPITFPLLRPWHAYNDALLATVCLLGSLRPSIYTYIYIYIYIYVYISQSSLPQLYSEISVIPVFNQAATSLSNMHSYIKIFVFLYV